MRKFVVPVLWAGLLTLLLTGCANLRPPEFRGAAYTNPAPPPNFSLLSTQGGSYTLNEQKGKVILLFFGYTYCPDICPATMGTIKAALNQLSEEERQSVEVVFVTVDPERDTTERLREYLESFQAGFIGLVPTQAELEVLKNDYGVVAEQEDVLTDGSYLIAHTGLVFGIDREGNLQVGFFSKSTAGDIAHDIRILLRD
jgi:protein SCO1